LYVIATRARAPKIVWIGLLVVVLLLSAAPALAKKKKAPGGRYRLPVARRWMPDRKIHKPHHDYPAWDVAIPKRTVVKAVHAGRVRTVTRWGGCGRGLIIRGRDGYQYTYCHGSWVVAGKNQWVKAGQRIMLSGSTGHSTGPHLHLQIRGPRGLLLCPQPLLRRWARGKQVSPRATTSRGCAYSPDRAIYGPRRPVKGSARSAGKRAARTGRAKRRARSRDRDRPRKHRGKHSGHKHKHSGHKHKHSGHKHKHSGHKHKAHSSKRHEKKQHRRAGRKQQRRIAERRRRDRTRAERIRRETAVRQRELALAQRVHPVI
jgi:hypothetical protein